MCASNQSTFLDEASNLQHNYPFFKIETSEVLLRQYRRWTRVCGRPRRLEKDASRANLGETPKRALEADGTQLLDIPGQAHEQVARVEIHGRYFECLFMTVQAEIGPSTTAEWLECVMQTIEPKNDEAVRFRLQLPEIPEIPGDMLLNQPEVISSSSKNQIHRPPHRVIIQ